MVEKITGGGQLVAGAATLTGVGVVIPAEIGAQVNAQIKRIADDRSQLEAAWQKIKELWDSNNQDSWVSKAYEFFHDNVSPEAADIFFDLIQRLKFDQIPDWIRDWFT